MYSRIETITPEIAETYLKKNVKNRRMKPGAIRRYARDMASGKWQLTPQGISFYENGNLADGQNRLEAVKMAGVSVDFYVTYDVPNESTIQDRGVGRSSADVLKMSGINSSASTTNGVALTNMLFWLAGYNKPSEGSLNDFILENEETICSALRAVQRGDGKFKITGKAPITAAAFCALYCGLDFDGLCEFFACVNTGYSSGSEQDAAILLRNYLIQEYTGASGSERKLLFVYATNAIKDFASSRPRRRKYPTNTKPAFWEHTKKCAIEKYTPHFFKQ